MVQLGMSQKLIGTISYMAYEDGHSSGQRETLAYLQKYTDLAVEAFREGRQKT